MDDFNKFITFMTPGAQVLMLAVNIYQSQSENAFIFKNLSIPGQIPDKLRLVK